MLGRLGQFVCGMPCPAPAWFWILILRFHTAPFIRWPSLDVRLRQGAGGQRFVAISVEALAELREI